MHYLTNYYKNLSEQLQEKLNFLEAQLNEYLVRPGEKDGKKGTFFGNDFVPDEPDEEGKKSMPFPLPYSPTSKLYPRVGTKTNPSKPGLSVFRKPLIGEEPGSMNPERKPIPGTTIVPETKPSKPGIDITPKRKPNLPAFDYLTLGREPGELRHGTVEMPGDSNLIGKVPGLGDTDAINVMPEPDRDAINIMPKFGSKGPVRRDTLYTLPKKDIRKIG